MDLGSVPSFIDLGAVQSPQASGVTGTSATTNANFTSAASGTTTIVGSSATTNANFTSSAVGTTTIVGTSATTNANFTSSASGTTTILGSSATTNADFSSAASGNTTILGTSATTNANFTSSASGSPTITGTSATTNADFTSSASGATTILGTSATTNANFTSSAAGSTTITGASATTNANFASAAAGSVGSAVTGTSATTNANFTSAASGVVPAVGTAANTLQNFTSNGQGTATTPISGTAANILQNFISNGQGESTQTPQSLDAGKIPYYDEVTDKTNHISRTWLKYFQTLGARVVSGMVSYITGTPGQIVVSGPQATPTISIPQSYTDQFVVVSPSTNARNIVLPTDGGVAAITLKAANDQTEELLRVLNAVDELVASINKSGLLTAKQGVLQQFSIEEDLTIPAGWYSQMVDPIVEVGVTVDVDADGLWFLDG